MGWLNVFGLAFMAVIMLPNIVFALRCRDGFENRWHSKAVEVMEQIGRFGCFGFMVIRLPGTCFGWWSDEAFAVYLLVDVLLIAAYCAIWVICRRRNGVFRSLALSILPSAVFLFSGVMSRSVPLLLSALLFAPTHILLSHKNAKAS